MWGKLLLSCVLVCALVAVVSSERDGEEATHQKITMGKSGPVCTKQGRKCVFNATCEDNRCRCPAGQRGQAEIECVNKREHLCYIAGDPHIRAFGKALATIALPCRFRATRFVTKNVASHSGHGTCSFEVYATNELLRGRYVVRSVHISVGISDPASMTHTAVEVYKTVEYNVNDTEIYNYQARTIHRDSIWGSSKDTLDGVTIVPSFDEVNNFATLDIPACGTRIKYRAFDRRRAKHQKQLPGLTIQAPQQATWYAGLGDYPFGACGVPSDPRSLYNDRAAQLNLTNDNTAVLYDILAEEPDQKDNRLAGKCSRSFNLFKSSTQQIDDINYCGFLLTDPRVGRCIEEEAARLPIDIFNACLAMRQNAGYGCFALRRAARICGPLEDWTGPASGDINCPRLLVSTTEPPAPESFVF
ncbi:hypothetical protein V1264_023888 [Littorina saxatilis]|uniref:Uncharacterized protein n=1 Tax=Littorina saxatilis TaxID=31220 RepID=A0AAN9GA98_9CAEN